MAIEDVDKVSRVISYINKSLVVKIHIKLNKINNLTNTKETFHKTYNVFGVKGIKIDVLTFLTLEIVADKENWDKTKSLMITPHSIYKILKPLKECRDAIYNNDIFYISTSKGLSIYADEAEKFTRTTKMNKENQSLFIKPALLFDENETSYEGVYLYLNKIENLVELSIEELDALVYILDKVDMFVYSQALLNYFVNSKTDMPSTDNINQSTKPVLNTPKSYVQSNIFKKEKSESFFKYENPS